MFVSRRTVLQYAAAMAVAPTPLLAETADQRIVSLDYGLSSSLLSLGLPPVGISDLADWGRWVVEPTMPEFVVDIGSAFEVNLEILLQLKPDIILTTPYLDELAPRLKPFGRIVRLEIFTPDSGPVLQSAIAATRKLSVEIAREREAEAFLSRSGSFL
jgi:ABC-type Fe3+-hydroxamate transport system substrate-binding protein